jgi:hypothetical protein
MIKNFLNIPNKKIRNEKLKDCKEVDYWIRIDQYERKAEILNQIAPITTIQFFKGSTHYAIKELTIRISVFHNLFDTISNEFNQNTERSIKQTENPLWATVSIRNKNIKTEMFKVFYLSDNMVEIVELTKGYGLEPANSIVETERWKYTITNHKTFDTLIRCNNYDYPYYLDFNPVYYGSSNKIADTFNSKIHELYFSSDIDNAKTYGENLVQVYVDIVNPLIINAKGLKFPDTIPITVLASNSNEKPFETVITLSIFEIVSLVKNGKALKKLPAMICICTVWNCSTTRGEGKCSTWELQKVLF